MQVIWNAVRFCRSLGKEGFDNSRKQLWFARIWLFVPQRGGEPGLQKPKGNGPFKEEARIDEGKERIGHGRDRCSEATKGQ